MILIIMIQCITKNLFWHHHYHHQQNHERKIHVEILTKWNLDCARRIRDKYVKMKILWNDKILWWYWLKSAGLWAYCAWERTPIGKHWFQYLSHKIAKKWQEIPKNGNWQKIAQIDTWVSKLKLESIFISLRKGNDPECKIGHNMFISFAYN